MDRLGGFVSMEPAIDLLSLWLVLSRDGYGTVNFEQKYQDLFLTKLYNLHTCIILGLDTSVA